ncbi:hypothetical protein Syun_003815 [Stephania yunnanensis]|uniref:Uncharacterized protein n=1 Tax=Stephania yunnanensis TaxID=152371 RepID=A0AAP0L1V1_9MAGN
MHHLTMENVPCIAYKICGNTQRQCFLSYHRFDKLVDGWSDDDHVHDLAFLEFH